MSKSKQTNLLQLFSQQMENNEMNSVYGGAREQGVACSPSNCKPNDFDSNFNNMCENLRTNNPPAGPK